MTEDYEIGRGRPPRKSQFKKGQCANPHGRPKKNVQLDNLLQKELKKTVQVSEGGKVRTRSKAEAVVVTTVNKSLGGNLGATKMLLSIQADAQPRADDVVSDAPLPEEEIEILKIYLPQLLKRLELKK